MQDYKPQSKNHSTGHIAQKVSMLSLGVVLIFCLVAYHYFFVIRRSRFSCAWFGELLAKSTLKIYPHQSGLMKACFTI
jgi:hypothetical protein